MKILMQETDEAHPLSLAQLVEKLEGYGVEAERKSLYDDMEVLRVFGIDIEKTGSRNCVYYVGSRTFEVAELKLLVDAVQASKFITRKKSSDLIKKMESLASVYEALQHAKFRPQLKEWPHITNAVGIELDNAIQNAKSVDQALADAQAAVERLLQG